MLLTKNYVTLAYEARSPIAYQSAVGLVSSTLDSLFFILAFYEKASDVALTSNCLHLTSEMRLFH